MRLRRGLMLLGRKVVFCGGCAFGEEVRALRKEAVVLREEFMGFVKGVYGFFEGFGVLREVLRRFWRGLACIFLKQRLVKAG